MISDITIGTFAGDLALIVAIVGGFAFLYAKLKTVISDVIKEMLSPVTASIDALTKRVDSVETTINDRLNSVDMESCKNFLVRCLGDLEKGNELSEAEKTRFWEQYDYYRKHGENSYIKNKAEHYKNIGKL